MCEKIESWVRVGDEQYEDCLVGNRKGLEALRTAIDGMFERGEESTELANYTNADFDLIVLAEDHEVEKVKQSWPYQLLGWVAASILIVWLIILPLLGIYGLVKLLNE